MAQYGVSFTGYFYAWDTAAGTFKTGDSANITTYWNKDGTNSTTSNSCAEVSSANVPGQYKVTLTASEATCTAGVLGGKSSTSGIIILPVQFHFDAFSSVLPAGGLSAIGQIDAGTLQSATGTTAVLRSAFSSADSRIVGMTIEITGGTGAGQSRIVTAYNNTSKTVTVDTWTTTPSSDSIYIIWPTAPASVSSPPAADVRSWNGSAVATPATAGVPDVNAKNINNVSTSSVSVINANVGTTQPVNFTGTGGSALAKSDMVDIAGAAVNATSAQIGANLVNISGSAVSTSTAQLGVNMVNVAGSAVSTSTAQLGVNVVSGTGNYGIKKNTQLTAFPFLMTDSTNHAPATGLTVTATRSIDGAAFASCANAPTEIANGWYKITLATTDLNGNTIALKFTAASSDQQNITIVTSP